MSRADGWYWCPGCGGHSPYPHNHRPAAPAAEAGDEGQLAELDALRATVARVEALADSWDDRSSFGNNVTILTPEWHMAGITRGFLDELRAALRGG